jgi:cytosine/adenosine deaminase-related metal-dependent hydrolase
VATVFRAKKVVTMAGPVIENGAVAITGDRISAVGSWRELQSLGGNLINLGDVALLPGLINSHCHLDYTILAGRLPPQPSFADWIRQINSARRELTAEDYLRSIANGISEAQRWGTTSVANVESMPEILSRLPRPPLRIWWFAELIDVQPRCTSNELVGNATSISQDKNDWLGGFGLSPHAPYTVSPELLREAVVVARRNHLRLTMHLAESDEEMEMFSKGRGRLFDLLQGLGRTMEDCQQNKTPLALMLDRVTLDDRWIVVHLNELTESDFDRLAQGPHFHIAHCPGSGRYFQHRPFALRRLLDMGFNICLGTDSLASNSSLSLFAEMRILRQGFPWLEREQILRMATVNGARALGEENSVGKISEGFYADLIAIPLRQTAEVYEQIIDFDQEVPWMMLAGQVQRANR